MVSRTVSVRLLLNPAAYTAGAAQVNRANAAMTASTTATATRATAATGAMTAGLKRTGASMGAVAAQAGLLRGGLTTPLAAAGAAVIGVTKAAIDWESSWAGVTKTVDGSATQMERLEGDLRNMAKELPATHGEIAKVAETAGQLGVSVGDVSAFTRTMVDLGETTNLSAEQAATSIARMTNIMGTSQGDVERLGSSLVDLGNNSATTEAEILTFSTRLAAAGNIAGLSEADVLAFGATLTSVGVEAEAGGTALSKTFIAIRDAVLTGSDALDTFAEVAGVTAEEFAASFREDPALAIASFIEGLGRMNAAGESTTAVFEELSLTDQRLMRALLSTAEAGDLLTDSIHLSSDAWSENTALADEAARRYATTAAALQRSWNTIKDAAIDAGGVIAPALEEAVGIAAEATSAIQGLFDLIAGGPDTEGMSAAEINAAGDGPSFVGGEIAGAGQRITGFGAVKQDLVDLNAIINGAPALQVMFGIHDPPDPAEWVARFESEIQGLNNRMPQAVEDARGFREALLDVSDSAVTAAESMAAYSDQVRAQTDPVFALFNAVQQVEEAQTAYNEAVDEYGKNSPEAISASVGIAEAVAAAEAAALNGELSFDDFDLALQRWVDQGVITEGAADDLREGVKALREESEDYTGAYEAQFEAGNVAKSKSEVQGLINRAQRWDRPYTAGLSTSGAAKAASEVQGLLNRAAAWRGRHTATFIANNIVRGSVGNLLAGRGHDGGMVTTAGIQKFHGGGEVTSTIPRFHEGTTRLGANEVPAILEVGEAVVSKRDMAMAAAMSARPMGRSAMGGGVMEFRHTFVAGPGGNSAFVEMANFALRKGQLNINTEAIQR